MARVRLTKKGLILQEWDGEKRQYDQVHLHGLEIIQSWHDGVDIDPDVTLGDLIENTLNDDGVMTFVEMVTRSNIRGYVPSMYESLPEEAEEHTLTAIELYSYAELDNYDSDVKFPTLVVNRGCHGYSDKGWKDPNFPESKENHTWAIEFTPWAKLRDLPIRIKMEATLTTNKWVSKGKPRPLFKGIPDLGVSNRMLESWESTDVTIDQWTFGDVMQTLFDELCFCGGPIQAKKMMDDLKGRIEEIKDGKAELVPLEIETDEDKPN